MKLEDARDAYYDFSKNLSDINRKLAFSGIALIWLFREVSQGKPLLPRGLRIPTILLVSALGLDFLQYIWATAAWGRFSRTKEKNKEKEFHVPVWINWPTLAFFWSKIGTMALAYLSLLRYLFKLV
jgi:hypothetical protein